MANLSFAALARSATLYDRVKRVIPPPEWATFAEDVDAILELKRSRNAVVLAHNYQTPEIFHGVADIVGDSLLLAREATKVDADIIVLAGVHFMEGLRPIAVRNAEPLTSVTVMIACSWNSCTASPMNLIAITNRNAEVTMNSGRSGSFRAIRLMK